MKDPTDFTITAEFYQRGCVDWEDANPAKGFVGNRTRPLALSTANTVIACMHPGNYCYPGKVEWGPEGEFAWWTGKMANLPRIREIIEQRLAPLLACARRSGLRIIYLIGGWQNALNYPQYRELLARVKEPEIKNPVPRSPDESWRADSNADHYGAEWRTPERNRRIVEVIDVAPPIKPHPADWIAATTAQTSTLLSENGIWNILYTGFDTNGCVWVSPGGMLEMGRLGYRTLLLRDCTTGAETAETYPDQEMTESFFQLVRYSGYTSDSASVITALDRP